VHREVPLYLLWYAQSGFVAAFPCEDDGVTRKTITIVAGQKSSGEAVTEELLVDELGGDSWRLVASPGIVLGVAAGDTLQLGVDGAPIVTSRGGNLAVQVYSPHEDADSLLPEVERLGGTLDARASGLTVFTLPVSVGFAKVEEVFRKFVENHPGAEWYFANVYADDGVTPLGWWENS
jgi:hypothetical protein